MIALTKGPIPPILVKNAAKWTNDLLTDLANGGDGKGLYEKYRDPDVKAALISETNRKCAYCESKPLAVTYGDIEHVVPKKISPDLAFNWSNLTLACDVCNTKKAKHEDLIDPYNDNTEEEFSFYGPMIMHKMGRDKAELTKTTLHLNRIDLIERRQSKLSTFTNDVHRILSKPESPMRDLLLNALVDSESADEQEYAACVRVQIKRLKDDGLL